MTNVIYKINRPSLLRWAIGFLLGTYFSTSKASPNDSKIVIIVIIVVDEEMRVQHGDGIIAQRNFFNSASFSAWLPKEQKSLQRELGESGDDLLNSFFSGRGLFDRADPGDRPVLHGQLYLHPPDGPILWHGHACAGLLFWFVKDVPNEAIQRGMAVAMLVGALAGLFVTALGAFTGTLRTNGWISIVSYVILGAGYALILFLKRGTSQ